MTKRISLVLLSLLMLVLILASCGGAVEISVSFVVDGETYHTVSTTGESAITMPQNPTKEGYVFEGWYWDNNTFQKPFTANSLLNQELSGDMSVYAKWTKEDVTQKNYDLIFNSMGGSEVASQSILYGNVANAPTNPTKTGYIFVGWYKEADLKTKWNFSADTVTENTTLYAKWVAENDAQGSYIIEAPSFEINDKTLSLEIPNAQEHVVISELITVSPYATYKVTTDIEGLNEIPSGTVPVSVGDNTFYILVTSGTGSNKTQYTVNVHRRLMLNVTYSFNNGSEKIVEAFEEDSKITTKEASKTGYTFIEWQYNGEAWDFANGVILDNMTLEATYTANEYTVSFNSNGGAEIENATVTFDAQFTFEAPEKLGYTFDGWRTAQGDLLTNELGVGKSVWTIADDTALFAQWTPIVYTITYECTKDAYNSNPVTYTIESETITLADISAKGYDFNGWTKDGEKIAEIVKGSTGNIVLSADWTPIVYTITYEGTKDANNSNPVTYTIESETITLADISAKGYTFNGWTKDGEKVTEIVSGSIGNVILTADWSPIGYEITYHNVEGATNNNAPTYDVMDEPLALINASKTGYSFLGWYDADDNKITEIAVGTTGDLDLWAKWEAIEYTATFMDGTTVVDEIIFTVETESIDEPSVSDRIGYTGVWESYTLGASDITVNAVYTPIVYTITYEGTKSADNSNPVTYTIESATITLADISANGYIFNNWTKNGEKITEIARGSIGNITLTADWTAIKYNITYMYDAEIGDYADENKNPATYTIEDDFDFIALTNKTTGYTFDGWYTQKNVGTGDKVNGIEAGSMGDITIYAQWALDEYKITYHNANGVTNTNATTYTVETDTFKIFDISKNGYSFGGWYDADNSKITEIVKGSTGDLDLYAKWEIITYSITYVTADGTQNANQTTYTVETDLAYLTDAALKGHTFGGWYKDSAYNTRVYQIGGGETGNITLYAKFSAKTYDVYLDGTDEASFDVSFDLNGGSGSIVTQTITESNTLKYPTVPTREGYVFGGWYLDKDCTGDLYDFTALITSDITLYAKWVKTDKAISVNSNVTVTLNGREEQKFTFVPLVNGNVTFTTTGSYDTLGILYDEDGNVLKLDDDTGSDGINFQIVFNVTAGKTYAISVSSYSSATNGTSTLYVSGSNTVNAGGYVITGNKAQATYGQSFTLPVPSVRDGYKFLGYADKNGTMYTDGTGASVKSWDKDETTLLVSVWERTVYTITFNTAGGSAIEPVSLAYGERLDISKYVPTYQNKAFVCWMLDGEEFNATTMPDHNITLTARWATLTLGADDIKYDPEKIAISVNDTINAELFGAICVDMNGKKAEITVSIKSGKQEAGQTISVVLVAKSGTKTAQKTIEGIKVYGTPTLEFDKTVDYVNLVGGMTSSHFQASGKDSFGSTTEIKVYIEGDYKAGDTVTVTVESVDPSGNVTKGYIENVKAYGLPDIIYSEEKTSISVNDILNADLFGASAKDSFGNDLTVTVSKYSGTISAGNTVTIRISATDSKGNVRNIDVPCKIYGNPTVSDALKTDATLTDNITVDLLGITAKDTYGNYLDISLTVKSGEQKAGTTMVVTATVTDIAGNVITKDFEVKIYGTPTLSYDREGIKTSENPVNDVSVLNVTAKDSFGKELLATATLKSGKLEGGSYASYILTVSDHLGNTYSITTNEIPVYDIADIEESFEFYDTDIAKLDTDGSEFNASAKDSFGNDCVITIEAADGSELKGGTTVAVVVVATDKAGNRVVSDVLDNYGGGGVSIYGMPTVIIDEFLTESTNIAYMGIAYDSFGEELYTEITLEGELTDGNKVYVTVKATDDVGNELNVTYTYVVNHTSHVASDWMVDKEASCTAEGSRHKECTVCEKVVETETLSKLAHTYENGYCSVCGAKQPYTRDGDYIYFGEYPQTIKDSSVTITTTTDERGYYLGSDGEWYAKVTARPKDSSYTFSTGATVTSGTVYYFKVEPIRWRILSTDGNTALILCDSIIANRRFDEVAGTYGPSEIRKWLNKTFYETAFDELQKEIILITKVDNSVASAGCSSYPYDPADTEDNVFLLSYKEVTNSSYGFSSSNLTSDTARRMLTSDYSRATGVYMRTSSPYYGSGHWLLRSPDYDYSGYLDFVRYVYSDGGVYYTDLNYASYGIVPALNIKLN